MNKIRLVAWFLALSTLLWQTSGGALALEPPTFHIIAPNGGEDWAIGTTQNITWDNGGYTLADIYYSTAGNDWNAPWTLIVSRWDLTANSSYAWVIPNTPTTTAAIKINAYLDNGPEGYYFSENVFTISQPISLQTLTVVYPNGGESWKIGTIRPIRWTSSNIRQREWIRIEIFRNNQWRTIGWVPNFGFFLWRVTGPRTDSALVRVSLISDSTVNDVSDAYFKISNR